MKAIDVILYHVARYALPNLAKKKQSLSSAFFDVMEMLLKDKTSAISISAGVHGIGHIFNHSLIATINVLPTSAILTTSAIDTTPSFRNMNGI